MAGTQKPNPLPEMTKTVKQEMEHIPGSPKDTQRILRYAYQKERMKSLGKNALFPRNRSQVMKECLHALAEKFPNMEFHYHKDFFGDCG